MAARCVICAQARRFASDRSGAVAIMAATLLSVVMVAAAFAVDQGSLYFERREAQALTDLAAITAAAHLQRAPDAALITFTDNHKRNVRLIRDKEPSRAPLETTDAHSELYVETGRYKADPDVSPEMRFTVGGTPPNAVRVTYRRKGTLYFGSAIMEPPTMTTAAVAATVEEAAISVGSRLASVEDGVLNALLGALLDADLSLRAADYRALINTDVDGLAFLDALAAELNLTAGTYEEVLASKASIGQILRALTASVGQSGGARVALQGLLGSKGGGTLRVPLSALLDLGRLGRLSVGQGQAAGLKTAVSVMELIGASVTVANRSRQVEVGTDLGIDGLLGVDVHLAVGEPPLNLPWLAAGEAGTIVRTSQIRLRLTVRVEGPGGVLGNIIQLPIYVEVGHAEAKLRQLACVSGQVSRVFVEALPGVFDIWITEVDPAEFRRFGSKPTLHPGKLVDLPLRFPLPGLSITGFAHVGSGNLWPSSLTFTPKDIADGVVKSVSTQQLVQPLVHSLLSDLELNIALKLGGLGLGLDLPSLPLLKDQVQKILNGVAEPLDTLIYGLLSALGIRVGEADIRVNAAHCGRAVLVY